MKTVRWVFAAALLIAALSGCELFLGTSTLRIVNYASAISNVYISDVENATWGMDWLAPGDFIDSGASRDFEDITAGTYDVRLETYSGYWWEYRVVDLPRDQVVVINVR